MQRLLLSNGELQVELNNNAELDRLYYPYIGHEQHVANPRHKVGIWVDGVISWLSDEGWQFKSKLPQGALIANTSAKNESLGILLEFDDFVGTDAMAFFRSIHVVNLIEKSRNIRLYLYQSFNISGYDDNQDTAQFVPDSNAILHYRGRRAFVVGGVNSSGLSFEQFTVGKFGNGLDGSWVDALDGDLSSCTHEVGATDSVIGFTVDIAVLASTRVYYWLAVSSSPRSAIAIHNQIRTSGVYHCMEKTESYWRKWLAPSYRIADKISPSRQKKFIDSIVAIKSHIDLRGSAVANRTCSPQESAYALWPLIRLGYKDEALRFFTFCKQAIDPEDGYLIPSYRADGAWGVLVDGFDGGRPKLSPADTALPLFVLAQYQAINHKVSPIKDLYPSLIRPMADFLCDYIDNETKLPRFATTYSTAVVYASLLSSSDIADQIGSQSDSVHWRSTANDILEASEPLFNEHRGYLTKSLSDQSLEVDSFFASFIFGLVPMDDDRLTRTFRSLKRLRLGSGLYCRNDSSSQPDMLASLWMAQYLMEVGDSVESEKIIAMVSESIGPSGVITPSADGVRDQFSLSATGEYISTLLDTIIKQ